MGGKVCPQNNKETHTTVGDLLCSHNSWGPDKEQILFSAFTTVGDLRKQILFSALTTFGDLIKQILFSALTTVGDLR
jgi:hypothetical protein